MANQNDPDMLDEYDFSGGVRGKYANRYREGTNLVRLDEDVAAMFSSSEEVNINEPHYPLEVFWDEGSNAFICIAPDLLGCSAVGDTPEEAVKEMKIAMRLWIDAGQSMGMELPKSSLQLLKKLVKDLA